MSEQKPAITIADVARLAEVGSPDLAFVLRAFVEQTSEEQYDEEGEPIEPPEGVITLDMLRAELVQASRKREKKSRQAAAYEAWQRYLAQTPDKLAPQLAVADVLVKLYETNTAASREALLAVIKNAPLAFGIWGGLKRIYKRAEAAFDAELFGALSARIDVAIDDSDDVSRFTIRYMRKRAWRFIRNIGKGAPELYPQFAVEVMRRYPIDTSNYSAHIGSHIISHSSKKWGATKVERGKKFHATFIDAWKRSPDPLLLLLETCECDFVAGFAIDGLRELFPEVLSKVTPEWLGRLPARKLGTAHDFLIETLEGSPEFHQGKLKALGLHEPVLMLLRSPSAKARKYAIEYARSHATDLAPERLVDLLDGESDVAKFAAGVLTARKPRDLGTAMLARMLKYESSRKWATNALETEFDRKEIGEDLLVELLLSEDDEQSDWVQKYIKKHYKPKELPVAFFLRVIDDRRFRENEAYDTDFALERLQADYKVADVPSDWLINALSRNDISYNIIEWLGEADALPKGIDIERLKGLVFDSRKRRQALAVLGNAKLVAPRDLGLGWLLALARRADPQLHEWAHRYLLQHMKPEHFAEGAQEGAQGTEAGIARLFGLALGAKEPEAVRLFAQTYLRCQHPSIGRDQPESKQFGIKPSIPHDEYSAERIWPALSDARADVRKLAVTIARVELRRWKAQDRVYELGESFAKEVRNLAYDALMQAGEPDAETELALKPDELDAAQIFSMTESRKRSTRDVAMALIRKHYARIGGAERLGWLMQSADREVRLFAVRLLWEKHRPRSIPRGWKPPMGKFEHGDGSFADVAALRDLLRRLLFMVPPLRSAEKVEDVRARKLPASVAKRHVVEIVRDFGLTDAAFAATVAPVLAEFTGSMAKGEWEACLAALVSFKSIHGLAIEGMV